MIAVRRLLFLGAVLAATSATAGTALLGDGTKPVNTTFANPANLGKLAERFAEAKFLDPQTGLFTYQNAAGETYFALKLQPPIAASQATKTDLVLLVDATASQAGMPWQSAKALVKSFTEKLGQHDRVTILTVASKVNNLTGGMVAAKDAKIAEGLKALDMVVPLGAADLKAALSAANNAFDGATDRRKVICYLGDGGSVLNPFQTSDRQTIAGNLLAKEVQFFVTPLGAKPDVLDMSSIAASTGGTILRLAMRETADVAAARFHKAIAAPVLREAEMKLPEQVTLALPGKLPPLRGDVPTLVIGKLSGKVDQFTVHCKGKINGDAVSVTQSEKVQANDPDCLFLPSMVRQWSQEKDTPALVRADLALVFASTESSFAKSDLLTQAAFALKGDQLDLAAKLYAEVAKIDPKDSDAQAGIRFVSMLQKNPAAKTKLLAQPPQERRNDAQVEDDLLKRTQQRAEIEAQRIRLSVEETIRQARRDLATNPEDAVNRLKLLEQEIRTDPNISEDLRRALRTQLEGEVRLASIRAERYLAEVAEREALLASARAREQLQRTRDAQEERLRTAMAQFEALMARARYEESILKANEARAIAASLSHDYPSHIVPTLAVIQSDFAYQQSQWDRIIAQKRANFLAAMLTVDESSIPTPDEPPMYYPAPNSFFFRGRRFRNWLELSDWRKKRWGDPTYGEDGSEESSRILDTLNKPTNRFDKRFGETFPLSDHIDFIQKVFGITLVINTKAFQDTDNTIKIEDILNSQVAIPRMPGVTLETILIYLLAELRKGETNLEATYIIRGNYVEITTHARALSDRVVRVTDVGALVMPPINMTFGIGGGGGGGGGGLGGGGLGGGGLGGGGLGGGGLGGGGLGGGGLGGGFGGGGLGGGGLGGGGLGGGGLGGGGLGGGGLGGGGLGGGGLGGGGLGGGGGGGGLGGGQGGGAIVIFADRFSRRIESVQLENLIRVVITDGNWADPTERIVSGAGGGGLGGGGLGGGGLGGGGLGGGGLGGGGLGGGAQYLKGDPFKDDMYYYDPALTMVFKTTAQRNTRAPNPYRRKEGDAGGGAPAGGLGFGGGNNNRGDLAKGSTKPSGGDGAANMLAQGGAGSARDAGALWDTALKENGTTAGFTIAAVDFLTQFGKPEHAAEFIKAALRHGVTPRPWMFEALATTLELANGDPEEIEQALLSAADINPAKADGLLTAAKGMAKHGKWTKAVEFCRKSAERNPNHPQAYLLALEYAQEAQDVAAMTWASGNLLSRDWPAGELDLHARARQGAEKLSTALAKDGRGADAGKMLQSLDTHARRDLVVKLTFQGEADLDLNVTDPTGATVTTLKRQSVGGSTLLSPAGQRGETFSVTEGYPGQYKFAVRRVWGRPVGNKATLEIVRNKGTAEEQTQRETLTLDDEATFTVDLTEGRRNTPAALVAPEVFRNLVLESRKSRTGPSGASQLETLASPVVIGGDGKVQAVQGITGFQEKTAEMKKLALLGESALDLPEQGSVALQTNVRSSADGKAIRVELEPVFLNKNVTGTTLPVIPGSGS